MGWLPGAVFAIASRRRARVDPNQLAKAGAAPEGGPAYDRLKLRQRRDLAAMRKFAMQLIGRLDRLAQGAPAKQETPAQQDAPAPQDAPAAQAPPPPADDRLLGKGGVIDGLNTLTQIMARVIDKERQSFGAAGLSGAGRPSDEQGLDRRITDELDRIASRQTAAGGDGADRAQS